MVWVLMHIDERGIVLTSFLIISSVSARNKEPECVHMSGMPGEIFYKTLQEHTGCALRLDFQCV